MIEDLAPTDDYDKPCPFPGCEVDLRTHTERRRHLQKQHKMSFSGAMDLLEGKGMEEPVDVDVETEGTDP